MSLGRLNKAFLGLLRKYKQSAKSLGLNVFIWFYKTTLCIYTKASCVT
jgi:hypothetical protein